MKTREATISDFKQLTDLFVDWEKSESRFDLTIKPSEKSRRTLEKSIKRELKARDEKFYLVAEINGELAGFSYLHRSDNTPEIGWIGELFVKEKFRRQGIATKLINESILWLKKRKKNILRLSVHRRNKEAQILYQKLGFSRKTPEYFVLEKKILNK